MSRINRKGTGKGGDVLDETGEIVRWSTTMRTRARELRSTMTESEKILWKAMRNNKFHGLQFYRQAAIDRYIVDFFCPRKRIVVEVDGEVHDEEEIEEHDEIRDEFLITQKDVKQIVRVTNDEVMNDLPGVLGKIARACGAPSPGHHVKGKERPHPRPPPLPVPFF